MHPLNLKEDHDEQDEESNKHDSRPATHRDDKVSDVYKMYG